MQSADAKLRSLPDSKLQKGDVGAQGKRDLITNDSQTQPAVALREAQHFGKPLEPQKVQCYNTR